MAHRQSKAPSHRHQKIAQQDQTPQPGGHDQYPLINEIPHSCLQVGIQFSVKAEKAYDAV